MNEFTKLLKREQQLENQSLRCRNYIEKQFYEHKNRTHISTTELIHFARITTDETVQAAYDFLKLHNSKYLK